MVVERERIYFRLRGFVRHLLACAFVSSRGWILEKKSVRNFVRAFFRWCAQPRSLDLPFLAVTPSCVLAKGSRGGSLLES